MRGFYINNSFSLYFVCLETFQINNQIMLHFVHLWYKELSLNITNPITVNQIDDFFYASISPNSVRYIIARGNQINHKNKQRNKTQGVDIHRILFKKRIEGESVTIYLIEEQHLPYWKFVHNKGKFVIVAQPRSITSPIHHHRGVYF